MLYARTFIFNCRTTTYYVSINIFSHWFFWVFL
uniref:Uncharacterized protein n=1 Tax=Lepeophtheirus salmonis TaxID=72036 RepID=A0A0K2UU36_LEPSM